MERSRCAQPESASAVLVPRKPSAVTSRRVSTNTRQRAVTLLCATAEGDALAASLRVEGTSPSPTKKGKGKKTSTSKAKTNELGGSDSDESDDFGVSDPEKLFPTA